MAHLWDPAWWTDEHSTSWERVKHAIRRDWEQTKGDLADNGVDLNQGATDTIRQAFGKQPIPPFGLPNPGPRHRTASEWATLEAAVRYGFGARLHYEDRDWDDVLAGELGRDWNAVGHELDWDRVRHGVEHGWHSGRSAP